MNTGAMGRTLRQVVWGAALIGAGLAVATMAEARATATSGDTLMVSAGTAAATPSPDWKDDAIRRAFRDVLDRNPSSSEIRDYRNRIERDGWTESDIRRDLRERYANRDRDRDDRDRDRRDRLSDREVDRIINRAYNDILHRDPDPEGMRTYRREMIDNGWSEDDVRRALRTSAEKEMVREKDAERIVRRAYQDILGREPDRQGLVMYRNHMVFDRWDERRVRDALQESSEYRDRNRMTREKAVEIVKRAYRSVLGREADQGGLENYVQGMLRQGWTEQDVIRELKKSPEYRNKR